jgi:hypothetical protein
LSVEVLVADGDVDSVSSACRSQVGHLTGSDAGSISGDGSLAHASKRSCASFEVCNRRCDRRFLALPLFLRDFIDGSLSFLRGALFELFELLLHRRLRDAAGQRVA